MGQHTRRRVLIACLIVLAGAVAATWLRSRNAVAAGPPEAIVEGFVSALAEHRFESAIPYLSSHMRAQTIAETLSVRVNMLEQRTGRLRNVRGVPEWDRDTRAYATAETSTDTGGPLKFGFGLVREPNGDWRIDELYDLGWKPPGLQ